MQEITLGADSWFLPDSPFLAQVEQSIKAQLDDVATLTAAANKHPYYKYVCVSSPFRSVPVATDAHQRQHRYNFKWTKSVQDAILTVLLDGWLGGHLTGEGRLGRLLTLEEVGQLFKGMCLLPPPPVEHRRQLTVAF